jgi:hypothetical protein
MSRIHLTNKDLELIYQVVSENNLSEFTLKVNDGSGIGYTIDIEFDTIVHERRAVVRIPIVTSENW